MRMMLKISPRGDAGNKAVADGTLGRVLQQFMERFHPEAAYFTTEDGERTAFIFFNLEIMINLTNDDVVKCKIKSDRSNDKNNDHRQHINTAVSRKQFQSRKFIADTIYRFDIVGRPCFH